MRRINVKTRGPYHGIFNLNANIYIYFILNTFKISISYFCIFVDYFNILGGNKHRFPNTNRFNEDSTYKKSSQYACSNKTRSINQEL